MKEMSDLICGKAAVGGNYNSTRDTMCTNKANASTWEQNKDSFHEDISCETPRKQDVLIRLRNATNTLAQLGITPNDIPQMLTRIEELKAEQQDLKEVQTECSDQYKQLLRLRQQTTYANDKKFLYGSLLDEKEIQQIEDEINDVEKEKDQGQDTEITAKDEEKQKDTDKKRAIIDIVTKKHLVRDNDIDL